MGKSSSGVGHNKPPNYFKKWVGLLPKQFRERLSCFLFVPLHGVLPPTIQQPLRRNVQGVRDSGTEKLDIAGLKCGTVTRKFVEW